MNCNFGKLVASSKLVLPVSSCVGRMMLEGISCVDGGEGVVRELLISNLGALLLGQSLAR